MLESVSAMQGAKLKWMQMEREIKSASISENARDALLKTHAQLGAILREAVGVKAWSPCEYYRE